MSEKDPREEKLPRWARELLAQERTRANRAEHRLAEHLETVEPTRIWYGDWQNKIYVPEDYSYQTVYFDPTNTGHTLDQICVRIDGDGIMVMGGRSVVLEMNASNTFRVKHR